MIIDKPKQKPKHRNMQLSEADIDQLTVFDELISDSLIKIAKIKTVQKKSFTKAELKRLNLLENPTEPIDFQIERLKVKKMITNYNKYRKAKKAFVKSLEIKR